MKKNLAVLLGEGAVANGSPRLFDEVVELALPQGTSELRDNGQRYILEPCRGLPDKGYELDLFNEFSLSNHGMQIFDLLSSVESVFTFNGSLYVLENSSRDKDSLRRTSEDVRDKYLGIPKLAMRSPMMPRRGTFRRE